MADHLSAAPLTERTVHLCIDMQRIFSSEGPWATPWMEKVLPVIVALAERFPERTVFTRLIWLATGQHLRLPRASAG
jgi:nicotinamidase-related amidase